MNTAFRVGISFFTMALSPLQTQPDTKADALLYEVLATYKAARTLFATVTNRVTDDKSTEVSVETLEFKRPYYARLVPFGPKEAAGKPPTSSVQPGLSEHTTFLDGKYVWTYYKTSNQYSRERFDSKTRPTQFLDPLAGLFFGAGVYAWNPLNFLARATEYMGGKVTRTSHYLGRRKKGEGTYQVVEQIIDARADPATHGDSFRITSDLYIGTDKLVHRMITTDTNVPYGSRVRKTHRWEEIITNLQMNKPLPDTDFTFTPPPGATLKDAGKAAHKST